MINIFIEISKKLRKKNKKRKFHNIALKIIPFLDYHTHLEILILFQLQTERQSTITFNNYHFKTNLTSV